MGFSTVPSVEEAWEIDAGPVFKARMDAALKACNKDEPARRNAFNDCTIKREKRRKAVFYPGGSLIKVSKVPGWEPFEGDTRGQRGRITGFSRKSRLAFLSTAATLDRKAEPPKFVTLTYPGEYPEAFQDWKSDLQYFAIYLARRYPNAAFMWKLEPQQRGAPHFHLLLWGVPFLDKDWLSLTWYQIVGSHDERHLRAGTRVENIRSWNGVMSYAGKNYMGKECEAPRNWPEYTGRYWGIYGRNNLPRAEKIEIDMSYRGLIRVHRLMRKYFRSKGIDWKTGGGVLLFNSDFSTWLRAFEWADEGYTHPIDFALSPTLQPF